MFSSFRQLGRKRSTSTRLVGASPEELDSIKELIHFDHVYYKQEESAGAADVIMEDAPATVAAAAAASPQDTYILSPPSIASSPPPLIGPSSHPASRPVVFTPASPATSVVEVEDTVVVIEDSNDSAPLCLMSAPATNSGVLQGHTLCPSMFKMIPSPSALSTETGYESAVSPLSDCSLREDNFFEESAWEDPLPELFPALV